jgi:hypothetical protein
MELWGYQIDTPLHLAVAFFLVLLGARVTTMGRSVQLTLGLIVLKEVVDFFATPRVHVHRTLHLDPLYDLVSGGLGVLAAYTLVRWRRARKAGAAQGD